MNTRYYEKVQRRNKKIYFRIVGVACIVLGLVLALYFFFPLISYQIFLAGAFAAGNIEVPVPKYEVVDSSNLQSLFAEGVSSLTTNFDDARNWYPQIQQAERSNKKVILSTYNLSIPKLGITDATVSSTNFDLSKNLVQYGSTTSPPELGTAVIFGHSTIPAWFDPHNYRAIFATLHTIKIGDEIIINMNGQNYNYKIFSVTITDPDDTNIFAQSFDNSYITIVTCTPPGTTWKRLVVRAGLEKS